MPMHLTNGDSAAERLQGLVGPTGVLPWRDMLHDGPVPAGLDATQLAGVRARYLAGVSGQDAAVVERSLVERDRALTEALDGERLDAVVRARPLRPAPAPPGARPHRAGAGSPLRGDARPGRRPSLGPERPGARRAGDRAAPIEEEQLALAVAAWEAFRAPTPAALAALLQRDLDALPHLGEALWRLLEELPAPETGLSRTERQILELLSVGPSTPERLFAECGAQEAARFLGDLPFFQRLERLSGSPPLVEGLSGRRFAMQAVREEN